MEPVKDDRNAEGASSTPPEASFQQESTKLRSIQVSVPQPSRNRASSDGKIRPFGTGRSRNSSSTTSLGGVGNTWTKAELYLTENMLCYEVQGMTLEVLLEDLIGVQIEQSTLPIMPNACEVTIIYFPFITKWYATTKVRRESTITIMFDEGDDIKDNLDAASKWKTAILLQTQRATRSAFEQADDMNVEDSVFPRKFLVFINPMAGTQKGETIYMKNIQPMFDKAEIEIEKIITKHHNHARDVIRTYDFSKIDGIILSSGDGLLYEVVNGIMEREDWERVIGTPIGMLPTGSGNALAASTLFESGEDCNVETAAFQIIRGGVVAGDLATIQLNDNTTTYMTLLGSWGIVADIDIESERFRRIGDFRFILGAVSGVVKKKVYRGKLSYLPFEDTGLPADKSSPTDQNTEKESSGASGDPNTADEQESPPTNPNTAINEQESLSTCTDKNTKVDENEASTNQNAEVEEKESSSESTDQNTAVEKESTNDPSTAADKVETQELQTNNESASKRTQTQYGPTAGLLLPLTEKVPDSWTTKEDDFFGVLPVMIPMLAKDFFGDRDVKIGSGKIRILSIDGRITRRGAIKLMTLADTGKQTDMDEVSGVDVKAFRLEPITTPGIITVDGESVAYGPIQGQIHPNLLRYMSRRRKT